MSKRRATPQDAGSTIAGLALHASALSTKSLGDLLLPKSSLLKRVLSSQSRNKQRLEVLKLNCDIIIPHVMVAEYNIEHGDYWNRDNSDIVTLIRKLCLQAIAQAFESAGCGTVNANSFVRDRAERFVVHSATTLLENPSEEITRDHELPSRIGITGLVKFLAPGRISIYKELWADNEGRISRIQRPSVGALVSQVYRHWCGGAPPRSLGAFAFSTVLEGSLVALSLATLKLLDAIDVS